MPHLPPHRFRAPLCASLLGASLLASWLLGGLPPVPGARASSLPAAPAAWSVRSFSAPSEQRLVALTNQARVAAGLPALVVDIRLASLARWRSQDMAERSYFSHQIPPTGETVLDIMKARGIRFGWGGENIGWNTASASAAADLVQQEFMGSQFHRDNILQPRYDAVGVGAYRSAAGADYFTVIFMDGPPVTATPPLAAAGHVPSSSVAGRRLSAWTSPSGGTAPYRVGWYLDGRWAAGGARASFVVRTAGRHVVGLVVVDARRVVVRRSYRMVALAP